MSDDHSEEWVSTTTLARELDTTEYVVRRMIHLGELTAYRIGRVIRIRREEADATGDGRPSPDPEAYTTFVVRHLLSSVPLTALVGREVRRRRDRR